MELLGQVNNLIPIEFRTASPFEWKRIPGIKGKKRKKKRKRNPMFPRIWLLLLRYFPVAFIDMRLFQNSYLGNSSHTDGDSLASVDSRTFDFQSHRIQRNSKDRE